jgi:hypothetical protein
MSLMKRFVGMGLVVVSLLLCAAWAVLVPASEPQIGVAILLVILEIGAIGIAIGVNASDPRS